MYPFFRYPLPTDDSATARSALPNAPQLPIVDRRPSWTARLAAVALRRLATVELSLAARFDPREHHRVPAVG